MPETTINDLPNEILTGIFKRLSYDQDLGNVQLVSPRWYAVVDETVGRFVSISSETCCLYSEHGFEHLSKVGVRYCRIEFNAFHERNHPSGKELSGKKFDGGKVTSIKIPFFKYPHLLTQFAVSTGIPPNYFSSLTRNLNNLREFEISLFTLYNVRRENLVRLNFPRLRKLKFHKCMRASWRGFQDSSSLLNLQALLEENFFPELVILEIRFPVETFRDFSTMKVLFNFLKRHLLLEELSVAMDFPVEVEMLDYITYQFDMESILANIRKSAFSPNLKVLDIQAMRIHGGYPQFQLWKEFLLRQSNLNILTLRIGSISIEILDKICSKNKDALEILSIYKLHETGEDEENYQGMHLDCGVFSQLKRVNTLYALGSVTTSGLSHLPSSLSIVFLTGAISKHETEQILLHTPNLNFLSLRNCYSKREGCGVSVDMLCKFIENRKLNRLVLNGSSLCDEFPLEGLSNGDPSHPELLIIYDCWDQDYSYVDWKLGRNGYYVNQA